MPVVSEEKKRLFASSGLMPEVKTATKDELRKLFFSTSTSSQFQAKVADSKSCLLS